MKLTAISACAGALFFSLAAQAHHSFAVHFVSDNLTELQGTVTGFRFSNPHGVISFDVKKTDGTVAR
jgi:Family of unknown function (DUF6152)